MCPLGVTCQLSFCLLEDIRLGGEASHFSPGGGVLLLELLLLRRQLIETLPAGLHLLESLLACLAGLLQVGLRSLGSSLGNLKGSLGVSTGLGGSLPGALQSLDLSLALRQARLELHLTVIELR